MLPAIWKAAEEDHRSAGWMWPFVWICFAWLRIVGCCDHINGILGPIKGGICLDSFTKVNLFLGRRIVYFSIVTRLWLGWLGDQGPVSRRVKKLLCCQPTDRFWDPSSLHVNGFRGPNRPRCEAYWPASGVHVMNARRYAFFSPCFMARYLFQRRDRNF